MREPRYVGRTTSGSHVSFLCPFTNFCLENVKDIDMNTQGSTGAVQNLRGGSNPLSTSFTADVLPEAKTPNSGARSNTGVSTRSVPNGNVVNTINTPNKFQKHWFALRTTYGREKKAYDFIVAHDGVAFYPTIVTEKIKEGKKIIVESSRLPNLFFAYGTEDEISSFVYDNHNLPFLRFYYKHTHIGARIEKTPLIVPDSQIQSLQIICNCVDDNVLIFQEEIRKFQAGQTVRVTEGSFKGVVGKVARYQGQQRVGVVIDGLLTVATAYIPSSFIEIYNNTK